MVVQLQQRKYTQRPSWFPSSSATRFYRFTVNSMVPEELVSTIWRHLTPKVYGGFKEDTFCLLATLRWSDDFRVLVNKICLTWIKCTFPSSVRRSKHARWWQSVSVLLLRLCKGLLFCFIYYLILQSKSCKRDIWIILLVGFIFRHINKAEPPLTILYDCAIHINLNWPHRCRSKGLPPETGSLLTIFLVNLWIKCLVVIFCSAWVSLDRYLSHFLYDVERR